MQDLDKVKKITFLSTTASYRYDYWNFNLIEWVDGLRAVVESAALQERSNLPPRENLAAYDCMKTCRKQLQETEICNAKLVSLIESNKGPTINCNDPDLLSLKALTTATVSALNAAYSNLQKCQYHEIKLINPE